MNTEIKKLYDKLISTGFGHLFGSSVINKILGLLSSVVIVRLIPKEEYGLYANANNILGLFCVFEGLGMTTALLQYGSTTDGYHKQQTWSFTLYFAVAFQIFLSALILTCALTVDYKMKGTGHLLLLMSFLPLVRSVRDMQNIYMRTELQNREFARANNF